jgi:hypothetical protein
MKSFKTSATNVEWFVMVEMVVELKKFRVMEAYREIPRLAHGLRPVFHKWRGGEDSKERSRVELMQTKELDMLIIHVGMELKLHKTLCHFLVAQLQDLEPNVSRKH